MLSSINTKINRNVQKLLILMHYFFFHISESQKFEKEKTVEISIIRVDTLL